MTQTVSRSSHFMTMAEYLLYDDGTDTRYELVNGERIAMPTESQVNCAIAKFLLFEFAKHLGIALLALKDTEIEVTGERATCRLPDLLVHSEASYAALMGAKRSILLWDMPPPALVVEVVPPGAGNRDRDYRYKRTEYAARGIAEYWIIDPQEQCITLCLWVNGQYEDTVYTGETMIQSPIIANLELSAAHILAFGKNE